MSANRRRSGCFDTRTRRPRRAASALVIALATAVALAACGVPLDDEARTVRDEDVPFGLLDPDRRPAVAAPPDGRRTVEIHLYSPDDERLVPVSRRVARVDPQDVLVELTVEPTESEVATGLRNPLADSETALETALSRGVLTVELSEAFDTLSGSDQLVAIAQIVYTATARPGIGRVQFRSEGEPTDILLGDGTLTTEPVSRDDYPDLRPWR
jgi:hypothetical protein